MDEQNRKTYKFQSEAFHSFDSVYRKIHHIAALFLVVVWLQLQRANYYRLWLCIVRLLECRTSFLQGDDDWIIIVISILIFH